MKKLMKSTLLAVSILPLAVQSALAETVQTCTQVTQYSGAVGIVCGAHTPIDTGLADINPLVLASIFFVMALVALNQYRKLQKSHISLN